MTVKPNEDLLHWLRENKVAIEFTDSKQGDGAKRCTRKWDQTARVPDGEEGFELGKLNARLETRNHVVVARASGLILIDSDSEEDWQAFRKFDAPRTYRVKTAKGWHAYYRPDPESKYQYGGIYFEKGAITPKTDCYVVGAGSTHPSGAVYEADGHEIAILPKAIEEAMLDAAGVRDEEIRERMIAGEGDFRVPHGQRHKWLVSRAGRNRKDGLSAEECLADLWNYYENHCEHEPPAKTSAMKQIVSSVYKYDGPEVLQTSEDLSDGVVTLADIPMKRVEYLIRPVLLRGTFHLFVGKPKVGKGQIVCWLMARVTSDDKESPYGEPRKVVVIATEDDAAYDLAPRSHVAGVDPNLVKIVKRDFMLPDDLDWLRAYVADIGDVGLVIIDPLASHTSGNTDAEHEVRAGLKALNAFSADMDVATVGVRHFRKNASEGGFASVLGSQAYIAVPRMVFAAANEPLEKDIVHVGIVASNRAANNEEGLVFQIQGVDTLIEHEIVSVPKVVAASLPYKDIDELLMEDRKNKHSKKSQAEVSLRNILTPQGELRNEIVGKVMEEVGCSRATVENAFYALRDEGFAGSSQDFGKETTRWYRKLDTEELADW